jgi:hypothetical protein
MAAANDTGSLYSIDVRVLQSGEDFVWTLTLTGFQKKQCICIYENGKKVSVHNHTIVEPVAEQVVRAKASLFTKSPKEYSFW